MSNHKKHNRYEDNQNDDGGTVTLSKLSIWKGATLVLGILLVVSLFFNFTGSEDNKVTNNAIVDADKDTIPTVDTEPVKPNVDMAKLIDDDAVKGDPDAPITMVEFSDYECPFCKRYYDQTYDAIVEDYVKTGKVKIVFRDYPLSFHQKAGKAAEAAECAGEQDAYFIMHDKIFDNGVSDAETYKKYAEDLKLDTAKFNECLDSGSMADEVAEDMKDGSAAGVRGTPAFIINGEFLSGAQPYANFKAIFDAELAK